MRASKNRLFTTLTLPLTVSVVAYSLGSAPMEPSRQSSPQAPAAQSSPQAPSQTAQSQPPPPASRRAYPPRQLSCWRVVRVDPAAVNQRWHIQDNAKGKIASVCNDASLTAEKKREKIQEINEQTDQEIAKIIPAKQLEAVKQCESEQEQERAKHQGPKTQKEKELGPCGGAIPRQPEAPKHSHGNQPSKPLNQ